MMYQHFLSEVYRRCINVFRNEHIIWGMFVAVSKMLPEILITQTKRMKTSQKKWSVETILGA